MEVPAAEMAFCVVTLWLVNIRTCSGTEVIPDNVARRQQLWWVNSLPIRAVASRPRHEDQTEDNISRSGWAVSPDNTTQTQWLSKWWWWWWIWKSRNQCLLQLISTSIPIFRLTPLSWPNTVGLKCPPVHKVSLISMKFDAYVEVDEWCMTVCSMTQIQSQGQGHEPLKSWKWEIWPFSKAISSPIYNGGQRTMDS